MSDVDLLSAVLDLNGDKSGRRFEWRFEWRFEFLGRVNESETSLEPERFRLTRQSRVWAYQGSEKDLATQHTDAEGQLTSSITQTP